MIGTHPIQHYDLPCNMSKYNLAASLGTIQNNQVINYYYAIHDISKDEGNIVEEINMDKLEKQYDVHIHFAISSPPPIHIIDLHQTSLTHVYTLSEHHT